MTEDEKEVRYHAAKILACEPDSQMASAFVEGFKLALKRFEHHGESIRGIHEYTGPEPFDL